ncbi:MAG: WD40 repeat domain-containing protein [Armatimonas sp.]
MARLTQQTTSPPQKSAMSMRQSVLPSSRNIVAPEIRPTRRRFPRWFLPVLAIAIFLTIGELAYSIARSAMESAQKDGRKPTNKHAVTTLPVPGSATYAVAPRGDRYLVGYAGYKAENSAHMELHKISGELLWSRGYQKAGLAFSEDGSEIFSGTEVLDARTGKAIVQVPAENATHEVIWSANGSRAVWSNKNDVRIWERTTGKMRSFPLNMKSKGADCTQLTLSPNGRWLAAIIYDEYTNGVALWDLTQLGEPKLFPVGMSLGETTIPVFSPDSKKLLFGRNGVTIYSLESKSLYTFAPGQMVHRAAWSPDGKNLVLRGGDDWGVYNATSGKRLWSASHHTEDFIDTLYFTQGNYIYYCDERDNKQWFLDYWDLSKVLKN